MTITPAAINFTSDYETIELELKLLTPMFGGGVDTEVRTEKKNDNREQAPNERIKLNTEKPHDPHTPIRGTAVRGALRHWWRATTGAWCETIEEMRKREEAVFGGISKGSSASTSPEKPNTTPSNLQLMLVADWDKFTSTPVSFATLVPRRNKKPGLQVQIARGKEGIAYGAFPMTQGQNLAELGTLHSFSQSFKLELRYPRHLANEVKLALSAFVHFGGVGGRTTRGFGQLAETSPSGKLYTRDELLDLIDAQGTPSLGDHVGAVRKDWYVSIRYDRDDALNQALDHLRLFRQAPGVGRRKNRGRSYWPEPDEIRRLTKSRSSKHSQILTTARSFPRARFGMPIITHFPNNQRTREPGDTSIQPIGLERMRSPLQISVHEDGYSYLVLTAPDARKMPLTLKGAPGNPEVTAKLTHNERAELEQKNGTLFQHADDHGEYDAVLAFLYYVKSK